MSARLACYGTATLMGMPLLFGIVTIDSPILFGLNIATVLLITFIGGFI
ncbi:hypothetical protein MW344_003769 [Vibrio parahaemolyticus]|uniref:Uncharacterized protein n=1 Tax=Vibrio parahaemolyticus TaxID=670 RepID=A0A9Q3UI98_VIBPH|nr:hypothetical protein [Vibrio parahaemolyticus]EGQ8101938.1 hypothetical protein [Vibrio parahaemolyticus]EGQ8548723.1 hypothetical protein [Vibrio parahaemolyticus]EHA6961287.1 hypothetical protein [Vibrio parahaemolyticus]EHA6975663.1 hypothetical protein [Vibrio parahaemolyticus]EIO3217210.1 hypothetical protein [Vibrio parahaemolyticus]